MENTSFSITGHYNSSRRQNAINTQKDTTDSQKYKKKQVNVLTTKHTTHQIISYKNLKIRIFC